MARKVNKELIKKIEELRKRGNSISEISNKIKLPKTTVYRYAYKIKVMDEYLKEWLGKRGGSKKRMLKAQEEALRNGRKIVRNLSDKELMLYASALYWAEGNKKDFNLSNTDPMLIRIFVYCLVKVFNVRLQDFVVSIRIYEDLDRKTCVNYWAGVIGIEAESIKSINIIKGKKSGKLKYGMCRVRVKKAGSILKKIMGINYIVFESLENTKKSSKMSKHVTP